MWLNLVLWLDFLKKTEARYYKYHISLVYCQAVCVQYKTQLREESYLTTMIKKHLPS